MKKNKQLIHSQTWGGLIFFAKPDISSGSKIKVKKVCKTWHLKQLICCYLKLSLLSSFVFLASFAFWRREILLIHKRADLRIKTVVICGQNLGGNWRNAEIMVDADFPEIIYEADFPQTASCGSPRAWEGAKSAVGANTNMSINTNTRSIIHT